MTMLQRMAGSRLNGLMLPATILRLCRRKGTGQKPPVGLQPVHGGAPKTAQNDDAMLNLLATPEAESKQMDKAVNAMVRSLDRGIEARVEHFDIVGSKLNYVLDNFGYVSSGKKSEHERKLVARLMRSTVPQVRQLVKQTRRSDDLIVILGNLAFRNQLDVDTLALIIMRLDHERLLKVHETLSGSPERLVLNWRTDPAVQMKAEIAIASRYKMLRTPTMASFVIKKSLEQSWLPKIKAGLFDSTVYMRNLALLLRGELPEWKLCELVVDTADPRFAYCVWEVHPQDSELRQFLLDSFDRLSADQQMVIRVAENPLVSGNRDLAAKIARLSFRMNVGTSKARDGKPNRRFLAALEVFAREVRDAADCSSFEDKETTAQLLEELDRTVHPDDGILVGEVVEQA